MLAMLFGRKVWLDSLIPAFKSYGEHTSDVYHLLQGQYNFQNYLLHVGSIQ